MLSRRHLLLALRCARRPGAGPPSTIRTWSRGRCASRATIGAHPDFRTEWWYLTGWLERPRRDVRSGFQVTFFRTRTDVDPANPSAFAARQLVIAHAALADPARGRLLLDERIARTGFGLVGGVRRHRRAPGRLVASARQPRRTPTTARIAGPRLHAELHRAAHAAALLQGDAGVLAQGAAADAGELLLLAAAARRARAN